MERLFYIYRHTRLDKNEVFYIGVGKRKKNATTYNKEYYRAFARSNRSVFWKRVVDKCNQYEIEIMVDDLTHSEANDKERELVALYGRKNIGEGTLVNLTDGGEGATGYKASDENKKQISIRCHKRRKGQPLSEEWKNKIRLGVIEARQKKKWTSISTEETRKRAEERISKSEQIKILAKTIELPTPKSKELKDKSKYEKPGPSGFPVICLDTGVVFDNSIEAAKAMYAHKSNAKNSASSILRVCNGVTKKYQGFKFQFV